MIWDVVGSLYKLLFRLQARGEFEYVKAKHLGDGFTGVPVTEIRGAILRPFLENRMSIFEYSGLVLGDVYLLSVRNLSARDRCWPHLSHRPVMC